MEVFEKKKIQSIQRAINIINCFDEHVLELSLNSISEILGLNINTTRGLMNTLVANNLVTPNRNNTYSLGFFFLQKAALVNKTLVGVAKEESFRFLEHLAEKYKVSSRLQIASSHSIFSVNTVNPRESHYLLVSSQAIPFPLHATASGKIFLAYNKKLLPFVTFTKFTEKTISSMDVLKTQLKDILRNGYSLEAEESGIGISSVAVPVLTGKKALFGTISITALSPIHDKIWESAMREMKEYVVTFSEAIFADIEPLANAADIPGAITLPEGRR